MPDLLPHEAYLGARFTAFEMLIRRGGDPTYAARIIRNVPREIRASFMAARGLGGLSVPA